MSNQRRYEDEEVRAIFGAAAEGGDVAQAPRSGGSGLTLRDLQDIGREVGLAPERIARAALALDQRRDALPRRTLLGMPVTTGRVVDLARAPTDAEWEMLVGELRATFGAQGTVTAHGGTRGWSNGNLHVFVEPTEDGYRMRMGTLKSDAAPITTMGIALTGLSLLVLAGLALSGRLTQGVVGPVVLGAMGVTALLSNMIRLPRWAREREAQMEHIAARTTALLGPGPTAP